MIGCVNSSSKLSASRFDNGGDAGNAGGPLNLVPKILSALGSSLDPSGLKIALYSSDTSCPDRSRAETSIDDSFVVECKGYTCRVHGLLVDAAES